MKISLKNLYTPKGKLEETIEEIKRGELSRTEGAIEVSYIPYLRAYRVLNGHHRLVEAYLRGEKQIEAFKSKNLPKMYNLTMGEEKFLDLVENNKNLNRNLEEVQDNEDKVIVDFLKNKQKKSKKSRKMKI